MNSETSTLELNIFDNYQIESANYVTFVTPGLHPDRILEVHDFLYIIDGTWEIIEDETVYELKNDDLLILRAGHHHYGTKPCSPNNRHMYIHLYKTESLHADDTCSTSYNECDNAFKKVNNNPPDKSPSSHQILNQLNHCQNAPKIKQLFMDIIAAYWSKQPLKPERISLLMSQLICELASLRETLATSSSQSNVVNQAIELLYTNPQRFFSCGEAASRFFICERTLSNQFKAAFHKTFYAYQMDMKLEMVRQYIIDHPDALLCEVARNFGFYDEFHLGKAYKKKYGTAPKHHAIS